MIMGRLFGTDGIRGIAGDTLTAETAYKLGVAIGNVLKNKNEKMRVFIGKDTRLSGDMLECALSSGLCASGADAVLLGVVPTPAVAYLVCKNGADAGVMISASHNKWEYNGLKVFSSRGYKLDDELEYQIEDIILGNTKAETVSRDEIGRVYALDGAKEDYQNHIKALLPEKFDMPRRVLIDLANGSASATAKDIFVSNGNVTYDFMSDMPNGTNINDKCGSTELDMLKARVKAEGYDIGIAFDGDADRCLCVDENGEKIDGDKILSLFSVELKKQNKLKNNTLVVTCLSNLGVFKMADKNGINIETTSVGDRYVLQRMIEGDFSVGGEQSGHIILSDYATTGDGEMTAAFILSILSAYKKTSSELFSIMTPLPQVSINVAATDEQKQKSKTDENLKNEVKKVSDYLGENGRILLRPSGTEALIRIMLEGEDVEKIKALGEKIAEVVKKL